MYRNEARHDMFDGIGLGTQGHWTEWDSQKTMFGGQHKYNQNTTQIQLKCKTNTVKTQHKCWSL